MRMTTNGTDYSRTECRKQMAIKKKKKKKPIRGCSDGVSGGIQMGMDAYWWW